MNYLYRSNLYNTVNYDHSKSKHATSENLDNDNLKSRWSWSQNNRAKVWR